MLVWNQLKGFNGTSDSNILYTYLNFKTSQESESVSGENNRPHIALADTNSHLSDLGYIVCNLVSNDFSTSLQKFCALHFSNPYGSTPAYNSNNPYIFAATGSGTYNDLYIQNAAQIILRNSGNLQLLTDSSLIFNTRNDDSMKFIANDAVDFYVYQGSSFSIQSATNTTSINPTSITNLLVVKDGDTTTGQVNINRNRLFCKNIPVIADYFNATSDRRAKDNLELINNNALSIVQQTPIYAFTYKQSKTKSIGIIAQDLVNIDLNGFSLVDNINASGEGEDFMRIHESKLVYVLWKAVQELAAEVDKLKKELNK